MQKRCCTCRKEKALDQFYKNKRNKDGRHVQCRECAKEACKRYREKNPNNNWRTRNKEHIREYARAYMAKRAAKDPQFRIAKNMRTRIFSALKGNPKAATTQNLTGCDPHVLREHLENQFSEGMSWDNYGSWHVDHIKPCASFDLTDEDQQRECFHYSNLQPMWQSENQSKGAR